MISSRSKEGLNDFAASIHECKSSTVKASSGLKFLHCAPRQASSPARSRMSIPELKGKVDGFSLRVPTPTVSIVDFAVELHQETTAAAINDAFRAAAAGPLKGILGVSDEPLVSMDFKGDLPVIHRGLRPDHGHRRNRRVRQGPVLVRQRMGLQLPRCRPDQVHRRAPVTDASLSDRGRGICLRLRSGLSQARGQDEQAHDPGPGRCRQARLRPRRFQRSSRGRQDHGRQPDRGRRRMLSWNSAVRGGRGGWPV